MASLKRLGGGLGRQARIPRGRTPKREIAKSERMQEVSQKWSRSRCTEGTGRLCAEGGGPLQTRLGERLGVRAAQNRTPSSPSPRCSPAPLPISLGHTPHASVQTHLLELTPSPNCTPTPALGTQGILAMCSVPSAGGKAAQ